ncbi:CinA family nicotinamide mononucleotide deamidase-related protein [Photobacterium iliopiscarium]|jgi:competence/damage-inducible protein CinA-like protein|uniref:CinA-like protein n=1 Tax=Photobacterium iliopiscarium TaxID=56192 RepID=A0A2T3MQX3_9GAMM|nr:CinA family nicotinamide mononucleotide deamidase-related protein [Photobacterium iliopiscarium]MCD9466663.1 competence/damage-inducible protein A [Photobacterium iliopiscarium]MCD9486406.1 CinA family nicotinamide mononucleotide deamidase-related protein [Photobacterium iliopiscarium]MCF2243893.1 CinA family nicotinamide mononucleotide deamidase-related protein [Photobacterium iliopiscarium]PSU01886.1 competence/damage-inducible protein A [Photobacterium iliopiscarium]PSV84234.1 competence
MLNVVMISTGEEVLYGDITDTNAAWLSAQFFEQGFAMTRRVTVGDNYEALAKEIEMCSLSADIVIVNGGLGPTSDDLTAASAAMAANVGLEQSDAWVDEMTAKYKQVGREMPAANLKQAMLPEGAELIDNPVGTACGFMMQLNRAWLFFTPGVPSEFKVMVNDQILPRLKTMFNVTDNKVCHRLYTYGLSESAISDLFQPLIVPETCSLGYRSSLPFIEIKLFAPQSEDQVPALLAQMTELLGDNIVGEGEGLLNAIADLLTDDATLALSEQSSGGFAINWLQDVPSLSARLAVSEVMADDIDEHACANELSTLIALRAQRLHLHAPATYTLTTGPSLTGDGFMLGLTTPDGSWCQQLMFKRQYNNYNRRWIIATVMFDMLRRYLQHKDVFGFYESLDRVASERL